MSHLNINGVDKPLDHIRLNNVRTDQLASSYNATGYLTQYNAALFAEFDIKPNTEYTLSFDALQGATLYSNEHIFTSSAAFVTDGSRYHVTLVTKSSIPENQYISGLGWLLLKNALTLQSNPQISNVMLNLGSTALPYQPYRITKEAWEARTRVILHGLTNPLCGIDTHKDMLDLSTGPLTRYIKKYEFTGNESGTIYSTATSRIGIEIDGIPGIIGGNADIAILAICTHYRPDTRSALYRNTDNGISNAYNNNHIIFFDANHQTVEAFQQFCTQQYINGTPVTVWYVLATPETEQISLPSNLTGIVEGYLTQSGTPTPINPIYPTANGTLEQGGAYSLDTGAYAIAWGRADTFIGTNSISARCYGLPVKSWEIDGNSRQSGTPAPDNIIMPEFVGERTENLEEIYKIDSSWSAGLTFSIANQLITINGLSTSMYPQTIFRGEHSNTPLIVGETYTGAIFVENYPSSVPQNSAVFFRIEAKNADSTWSAIQDVYVDNPQTFTVPSGYYDFRMLLVCRGTGIQYTDTKVRIMINLGSTAKPYEPYGYAIQTYSSTQNTVSGQTPLTLTDSVGHNLISWDGEGVTTSSGTPAPMSPVTVSGWGDRTENLLPLTVQTQTINGVTFTTNPTTGTVTANGTPILDQDTIFDCPIPENLNGDFYISGCPDGGSYKTYDIYVWDSTAGARVRKWDGTTGSDADFGQGNVETKLIAGHTTNMRIRTRYGVQYDNLVFHPMIRVPSASSDFEPYGYKLSLTSTGQTTPVYLGKVPTTRRVRKLVLTGDETGWTDTKVGSNHFFLSPTLSDGAAIYIGAPSTHYMPSNEPGKQRPDNSIRQVVWLTTYSQLSIRDDACATIDDFKTFLQQQYAAGTPVTVWYVLAEPTTGIVNEPLMKIGGYADSITSTQAGVTIPTAKGNTTLTTSNTVQPSTMHATYDKYISGGDVPVYLGQVPTTRKIKKIVLDGTESTWLEWNGLNLFRVPDMSPDYRGQEDGAICDSLPLVPRGDLTTNTFCWSSGTIGEFIININDYNLADLKTYLGSNPITIWYVLETPQTGIVNEPLAKIDIYADTLTSEQAGVTIPTVDGNNTISVDTSLAPSKFEVRVHAKPI